MKEVLQATIRAVGVTAAGFDLEKPREAVLKIADRLSEDIFSTADTVGFDNLPEGVRDAVYVLTRCQIRHTMGYDITIQNYLDAFKRITDAILEEMD